MAILQRCQAFKTARLKTARSGGSVVPSHDGTFRRGVQLAPLPVRRARVVCQVDGAYQLDFNGFAAVVGVAGGAFTFINWLISSNVKVELDKVLKQEKQELKQELKEELKQGQQELKQELQQEKQELKQGQQELKQELKGEKQELKQGQQELKQELKQEINQTLLFSAIVVGTAFLAIVVAAVVPAFK